MNIYKNYFRVEIVTYLMMPSKAQGIHLFSGMILMSTKLENILKKVTVALF
jgi:hypothetical protein